MKTAKQFLTFVSGGPFQYAVAQALALPDEYYARLRDDLMAQRDLLCDGLSEIGFEVYQPQGTYFVTADIKRLGYRDGVEFCMTLPDRAGVVAIPTAIFYDHPEAARSHVRFAFCKQPEVLTEALRRLSSPTASRSAYDQGQSLRTDRGGACRRSRAIPRRPRSQARPPPRRERGPEHRGARRARAVLPVNRDLTPLPALSPPGGCWPSP